MLNLKVSLNFENIEKKIFRTFLILKPLLSIFQLIRSSFDTTKTLFDGKFIQDTKFIRRKKCFYTKNDVLSIYRIDEKKLKTVYTLSRDKLYRLKRE